MNPIRLQLGALLSICLPLWACGGPNGSGDGSGSKEDQRDDAAGTTAAADVVATNRWPADPCEWLPAAVVESVLGPLAGPPRKEDGGCLYPLPEDTSPEALRRKEVARTLKEAAQAMARETGETLHELPPGNPAVILHVSVESSPAERAIGAAEQIASQWAEAPLHTAGEKTGDWDHMKSPISLGFPGLGARVGQLGVMVVLQDVSLPKARLAALADSVRVRIPDRPFQDPEGHPVTSVRAGPDPCTLLTADEAAEVLGRLTVPPYRTANDSPYPDPNGESCAYRTAGHRVLALTPTWSMGKMKVDLVRSMGGLLGTVMPGPAAESADTLEGPWEEAVLDLGTGNFAFLTGDRALEVAFGASATDASGAVRVARVAIRRLAQVSPR